MIRAIALLPLLLALAACGKEADEAPADDRRGAEGEVLGGTISDAMLPLDTVRSQSPPLRESPSPDAGETGTPAAPAEDETEQPDETAPEPEPEPAADTTPEESDG